MPNAVQLKQSRIRKARLEKSEKLDLSATWLALPDEKLTEIPDEVFELEHLKSLDLSNNALTSIPESIARLQGLESLSLDRNRLDAVPAGIVALQRLRHLHVGRNQLTSIPDWLCELSALTSLNVGHNRLRKFPESLSQMPGLLRLNLNHNVFEEVRDGIRLPPSLTALHMSRNQLPAIPKFIWGLRNLKELHLERNQITSIPEEIASLQSLITLDLSNNRIASIASAMSALQELYTLVLTHNNLADLPLELGQLEKLEVLHLSNNALHKIPKCVYSLRNLRVLKVENSSPLDRTGNKIQEISPRILQLEKLETFVIDNNPVEMPPPEVVNRGFSAVKDYFRQIEAQGEDYLYEAKLLIVGEAGAGKTSLAKKIKDANYQLQEEVSTKGIEVIQWGFNMPSGQSFRVNIWDFGGQEIYHATHQFFLTKRSLYILVADTRKEDTDFYYWLKVVELLSDNSPLLIVKNEKQDRRREINENQLRGQFSNLKETLATNLATNRGLGQIVTNVEHYISHLPHIGSRLPKTWVKVREALERDPRDYISLVEYLDICATNGFARLADKLQLSGYLHDLGVCLHFQEDPLLRKTVILKPKWGTDAVYKVLDNERVIGSLGRFNRSDLEQIWETAEYSDMKDELLQLMINFKLCYKIPNTEFYIAPQLLTANQPVYDWDANNNLILRYTYEFMPKGIITQFIVAMHRSILEQKFVWKSGLILEEENTRAEVIEHYGKREIKVRITGRHKNELLTIVNYEMDRIHESYHRLRFTKLIPCNCAKCRNSQDPHFYPFTILRQFLDDRQQLIQCQKSYQMVDVRGLIEDLVDKRTLTDSVKYLPGVTGREEVFISYSHLDEEWLNRLQTMMMPLVRNREISVWSDSVIAAGARWKLEIARAIAMAKVAVLLVSPNFLASEFIALHELPPLLNAAKRDGLTILWVPVSDSLYQETEIAEYQAASDPKKPLDGLSTSESNQVLVDICRKIKAAALSLTQ